MPNPNDILCDESSRRLAANYAVHAVHFGGAEAGETFQYELAFARATERFEAARREASTREVCMTRNDGGAGGHQFVARIGREAPGDEWRSLGDDEYLPDDPECE